MEMAKNVPERRDLIEQRDKSLEEIDYWSWYELVEALKEQALSLDTTSLVPLEKCLDLLVLKLVSASDESSSFSSSSSDGSGVRFSFESRSTESGKSNNSKPNWWFEDLVTLNLNLIEKVITALLSRKFDQVTIGRFLFYYQKSRSLGANLDKKLKIMETIIHLLCLLDSSSVSCKISFEILRLARNLNISKSNRNKLEDMIGLKLDEATLDNLLIPPPSGSNSFYDVNLVLRFLKSFLLGIDSWVSITRMKKVAHLIELYISEVAPDPSLKPSEFIALAKSVPDSRRDSYDGIYRAIDIYVKVHEALPEEEKMKICSILNYKKLSSETCKHLSQNSKFPSRTRAQAIVSLEPKLDNLLEETNHRKPSCNSRFSCSEIGNKEKIENGKEQVVISSRKVGSSTDDDKLREQLQEIKRKIEEVEKVCRKIQTQVTTEIKPRVSCSSNGNRSLPKLCS